MSWEDQVVRANPGVDRALVYLERAQHRGSKRLCVYDIEMAIEEVGASSGLANLLDLYEGSSYSMEGLALVAACFAADLRDPKIRREYHGIE